MITPGLVSIVIVCYNNWPDVELAIESALHQSYSPVEVIVVDNASSDATPVEVPKRFGNAIRYFRQPNAGEGGGRNAGMRVANGEFFQFLDGDDFLAPNKIAKQMEIFRADPNIDIVYSDVRYFQSLPGVPEWRDTDLEDFGDILSAFIDVYEKEFHVHSMLYRHSAVDRIGDWDETLYFADRTYWFRAAWAGCRFRYCPDSLSFYRRRPGQLTADKAAMLRGFEAVWLKALEYITRDPYRREIRAQLARNRLRMAVDLTDLTTRKALAKLAEGRATSRESIPMLTYGLAVGVILIPGGRRLLQWSWMRALCRWVMHLSFLRTVFKV